MRWVLGIFILLGSSGQQALAAGQQVTQAPATPAPEGQAKTSSQMQSRAEAAADVFIARWHETLDLNVLFDELYVSDAAQRRRNVNWFEGVYLFWQRSAMMPVDNDIDEALMRDFVFAFWNAGYLAAEYNRAYGKPGGKFAIPPELEGQLPLFRRATPAKRISREQVAADAERIKSGLPTYRKYLNPQVFSTATYISNLKREEDEENSVRSQGAGPWRSPRFRIRHGYPYYGVPENVEVYFLRKGGFKFYFIEERGKLKVLTLDFDL